MTHCRICGAQDQEIGESIICESCADKKENKNPKKCICDQYTTCEDCLNAVQNEGEKVLDNATNYLFNKFKLFTNKKYVFGSDWLADWFIEKIGYLRTPEGKESLEQFKKENRK